MTAFASIEPATTRRTAERRNDGVSCGVASASFRRKLPRSNAASSAIFSAVSDCRCKKYHILQSTLCEMKNRGEGVQCSKSPLRTHGPKMSDSESDVQLQPKLPVVKKKPADSNPFVTEKPSVFRQTLLFQPPTAKHRLVTCKASQVSDEHEKMVSGGLKPLVYSLNVVKPRVIPGGDVVPVYEQRRHGNIEIDVKEDKSSGKFGPIGYCELFGLVASAKGAAEELKLPTRGVIVSSAFNGDAARLFCALVLAHTRSDKLRKFKSKCAKPKAQVLRDFSSLFASGGDLEAFYYDRL